MKNVYRNDRARLEAEVERLRAELGRARARRRPFRGFALGLVAHVALRLALGPWLNGATDAGFWAAAVVAFSPLALGVFALVRGLYNPNPNPTEKKDPAP